MKLSRRISIKDRISAEKHSWCKKYTRNGEHFRSLVFFANGKRILKFTKAPVPE
jgi:hypothetical protein